MDTKGCMEGRPTQSNKDNIIVKSSLFKKKNPNVAIKKLDIHAICADTFILKKAQK
jgi:hypothetical protein